MKPIWSVSLQTEGLPRMSWGVELAIHGYWEDSYPHAKEKVSEETNPANTFFLDF